MRRQANSSPEWRLAPPDISLGLKYTRFRRFTMRGIRLLLCVLGFTAPTMALGANPVVVMETSYGTIKIELFEDKAPMTVKNFLTYVDDKHYDGTIFHRVRAEFMIQGGGFTPGMTERKTRDPIKNE